MIYQDTVFLDFFAVLELADLDLDLAGGFLAVVLGLGAGDFLTCFFGLVFSTAFTDSTTGAAGGSIL